MTEYNYKEGQRVQFNATIAYWNPGDEDRDWFPITIKEIREHVVREYILEGEVHVFEMKNFAKVNTSDISYLTEVPCGLRLPKRTAHSCYVPNKYFTPVSVKKDRFDAVLEGVM